MATIFTQQYLLSLLTLAAAICSAGLGILALTTRYKTEDGRLTRNGRIAICGILISAFLAIGSQGAKDMIASREREQKAAAARREQEDKDKARLIQEAQHAEQVTTLARLIHSAKILEGDMGKSLAAQTAATQKSEAILGATLALSQQERRSSARMLRSLWDTATRVDGSRVSLAVQIKCDGVARADRLRALFQGAYASVRVTPESTRPDARTGPASSVEQSISGKWELIATNQEGRSHEKMGDSGGYVTHWLQFGPFAASSSLGRFEQLGGWRDALAQIKIEKPDLQTSELRATFSANPGEGENEPGTLSTSRVYPVPCSIGFWLSVNGLVLASPPGSLAYYKARSEDRHGSLIGMSIVSAVAADSIPSFAGD